MEGGAGGNRQDPLTRHETCQEIGSAKHVIHYDLPWNPLVMEQRLGWTERLPNLLEVRHHVLVPDEPYASLFVAILRQVSEIEMAFGIALETQES